MLFTNQFWGVFRRGLIGAAFAICGLGFSALAFAQPAVTLPKPAKPTLTDNGNGTWRLAWTKPTGSNISGFDIHVVATTPVAVNPDVQRYARLDLANDTEGANCPSGDNDCYFDIAQTLLGVGPGSGGSLKVGYGANFAAITATNWSGSGNPSMRSELSDTTDAFVPVPYLGLVAYADTRAFEANWVDGTGGTFRMRMLAANSVVVHYANTHDGVKTAPYFLPAWSQIGHPATFPCTTLATRCDTGSIPTPLPAGTYYFGWRSGAIPGGNQIAVPAHDGLGGRDNPIVFPTVANPPAPTSLTATHGANGVTLTWTKSANRHSRFTVYYDTETGVTASDSSIFLRPSCINDTNNDATARSCTATIAYADLDGIDATTSGYFALEANINDADSPLSTEASAILPLQLSSKTSLNDSTQTLAFAARDIAIELGGAGGGDGSAKTFTLTKTGGEAADLAALGLEAVAGNPPTPISGNTSAAPITIRSIANTPAQTGSIALTYAVRDASGATPDSFSVTIRVLAEGVRAVTIVNSGVRSVDPDSPISEIRLTAVGFTGEVSYTFEVGGNDVGGGPLHGLTITPSGDNNTTATISGTPTQSVRFKVIATAGEQSEKSDEIRITVNAPAPPAASGGGSGGAVAAIVIAAGAYFWWKKRQIANGADPAAMALLPDVNFDLDYNDNRAFFTKINWKNAGNSNWQLRSNLQMHTKYSGKLLDWNANSHFGYRLNGKFGEFNPYLRGKFVQNAPENAKMEETYTVGVNYAIPNRFSVQFLQPDDEIWRYSIKTQLQLGRGFDLNFTRPNSDLPDYSLGVKYQTPRGFSVSVTQPNSEISNYSLGIQWRGGSRIRYEFSGNTANSAIKLRGSFSF